MIENGLDPSMLLMLSTLAVLCGVPLAMLLWIAAHGMQSRALRRRIKALELRVVVLEGGGSGAGIATGTHAADEPQRHYYTPEPTHDVAAPTIDEPRHGVAAPTIDEPSQPTEAQPRIEPTPHRPTEQGQGDSGRTWLDVDDLPDLMGTDETDDSEGKV